MVSLREEIMIRKKFLSFPLQWKSNVFDTLRAATAPLASQSPKQIQYVHHVIAFLLKYYI